MKKLILALATLSFLITAGLQAQNNLQALFYHAGFFSPAEGPYVETYLKVFGKSAKYLKNQNGQYQASLKVTLLFKQNDEIIDWRNYNLLSEEMADTTNITSNFIDKQRIPLPAGVYQMELVLSDNNRKVDPLEHAEMLSLEFNTNEMRFSNFQFVESFTTTEKDNILSKSGFDLVPFVGDFFDESVDKLTFYTELYNLDKKLGPQEDFLFRYYLESFETTVSMADYTKFQRQKASPVNVLLATLPIAELPSGNYNLVVEARDRKNEEIIVNKIFFMRSNPGVEMRYDDIEAVDITATFAEKITDLDSLSFYVASLYPTANNMEKTFIKNVVNTDNRANLQKFLYNFWKNRNAVQPEAAWNLYKKTVLQVEESFKTKIKHGFETDQGRVWLQYGAPDNTEFSNHEPNSYPYIIWHYYHLSTNQNNKRFVFYNPHLVGTEYILLHSDARGEIYNPYWQVDLQGRNTSLRNYDDASFDAGWGSRAASKFIK